MPYIRLVVSKPETAPLTALLASGIAERTARILRKSPEVTAVTLEFIPPERWFIAGRSLVDLGLHSFWLDVKVTAGTNREQEKCDYLAEVFAFMQEAIGPLHPESYVLVHEVPGDAYGYAGISQAARQAARLGARAER